MDFRVLLANKSLKDLHHRLGLSTDLVGRLLPEVWPRTPEKLLAQFRSVFSTGLPGMDGVGLCPDPVRRTALRNRP